MREKCAEWRLYDGVVRSVPWLLVFSQKRRQVCILFQALVLVSSVRGKTLDREVTDIDVPGGFCLVDRLNSGDGLN